MQLPSILVLVSVLGVAVLNTLFLVFWLLNSFVFHKACMQEHDCLFRATTGASLTLFISGVVEFVLSVLAFSILVKRFGNNRHASPVFVLSTPVHFQFCFWVCALTMLISNNVLSFVDSPSASVWGAILAMIGSFCLEARSLIYLALWNKFSVICFDQQRQVPTRLFFLFGMFSYTWFTDLLASVLLLVLLYVYRVVDENDTSTTELIEFVTFLMYICFSVGYQSSLAWGFFIKSCFFDIAYSVEIPRDGLQDNRLLDFIFPPPLPPRQPSTM